MIKRWRSWPMIGAALILVYLLSAGEAEAQEEAPRDRLAFLGSTNIELLEGSERRSIPGTSGADTFCWDRDGKHLFVTSDTELFRVSLLDGEREVLIQGTQTLRFPDVSPDGRSIVLACNMLVNGGQGWQIIAFDLAQKKTRILSDGYDPCFSSDGKSVLFERHDPRPDLWTIPFDGGTPKRLIPDPAVRHTVRADLVGLRFLFSQDGRLHEATMDGTRVRPITSEGAYDRFPSFSPDGRSLLFFREEKLFRGLVRRSLASGKETILERDVQLGAFAPPSLNDFKQISHENRASLPPGKLTSLDPSNDRFLSNMVEAGMSDGERSQLFLNGVHELGPAHALALAAYGGQRIFLPDLKSISTPTARALAGYGGSLFFDGLTTLDPSTAQALASWSGNGEQVYLSLGGWKNPDPDALKELAVCLGWGLALNGMNRITPAQADALAPLRCAYLDLDGIREIDPATANRIANWNVKFLSLRGLEGIEPTVRQSIEKGCHLLLQPEDSRR